MKSSGNAVGRRALLGSVAGAMAAPAIVSAQGTYPNKTVRYINPYPAGGPTDTLSRLFCAKMIELTGQQWIVENRGGAGTTLHLSGELFKMLAKVDMLHVPYRGSAPATQDLLAGQIHMMFDDIPGTLVQSRAGKVRPIAVTSAKRTAVAPEIPTIAETLPGFDIVPWTTLTGPAKLPPDLTARLSELSKKALESDDLKAKYADLGATAWWQPPSDTPAYRDSEEARLAPIIRASGARVD